MLDGFKRFRIVRERSWGAVGSNPVDEIQRQFAKSDYTRVPGRGIFERNLDVLH